MSEPTYTCPVCSRTSWNPSDGRYRYCGNCHGFTDSPLPPGFRWVAFHGEDGSVVGRMLEESGLEPGARYEFVAEGAVFVYDGTAFVEVGK